MVMNVEKKLKLLKKIKAVGNDTLYEAIKHYIKISDLDGGHSQDFAFEEVQLMLDILVPWLDDYERLDADEIQGVLSKYMDPLSDEEDNLVLDNTVEDGEKDPIILWANGEELTT